MIKREIINKANKILEDTVRQKQEYHEERLIIFKLLRNQTQENLEMLELVIQMFDKNERIRIETKNIRKG